MHDAIDAGQGTGPVGLPVDVPDDHLIGPSCGEDCERTAARAGCRSGAANSVRPMKPPAPVISIRDDAGAGLESMDEDYPTMWAALLGYSSSNTPMLPSPSATP